MNPATAVMLCICGFLLGACSAFLLDRALSREKCYYAGWVQTLRSEARLVEIIAKERRQWEQQENVRRAAELVEEDRAKHPPEPEGQGSAR